MIKKNEILWGKNCYIYIHINMKDQNCDVNFKQCATNERYIQKEHVLFERNPIVYEELWTVREKKNVLKCGWMDRILTVSSKYSYIFIHLCSVHSYWTVHSVMVPLFLARDLIRFGCWCCSSERLWSFRYDRIPSNRLFDKLHSMRFLHKISSKMILLLLLMLIH